MAKTISVLKPISATTETALQRAIFRNGKTILGLKTEIEWLDIELPVDSVRGGRGHCVDLIGKMEENYVICELKFGKWGGTDSPQYAADEVRRYYEAVKDNWRELDKDNSLHHKDGKPFKWEDLAKPSTELIVAANSSYWAYWYGHRKVEDVKIQSNVICCSIDIPANYFEKQKGNKDKYLPFIDVDDNHWDKL